MSFGAGGVNADLIAAPRVLLVVTQGMLGAVVMTC